MTRFNLSEWALNHRQFTGLLAALLMLGGVFAYLRLGQQEDPTFAFKVMVVKTFYPGATAREVEEQVTDRIEKKLQELPDLDVIRSYSKPGESTVFVEARQGIVPRQIAEIWYQARKKVGDIRHALPQGVVGPFFNDEFGDTYTSLYALTGAGYSYAELEDHAEWLRQELLRIRDVEKVDLIGVQEERIYVEFDDKRLAQLGLPAQQIAEALRAQNVMMPSGDAATALRNIPLRTTGKVLSVEELRELALRVNGRSFRLGDVAGVTRGYADPPEFKMRFNGRDGVGLGITINRKGDVLAIGRELAATVEHLRAELPVGVEVEQVADQPRVVGNAIGEFLRTFLEAVGVVLLVSFLSLGLRTGSIVALTVPLVLAGTFVAMLLFGIDIQRISLGALILALGLLVDDAMIAIELMARKMEEGMPRLQAATHAYRATAFPMLTGTLLTVAGFLPIALAQSNAGEYTRSIFQVNAIALVLSWFGAVIFTPFFGYLLLRTKRSAGGAQRIYDTAFYRRLRSWVDWCVAHRRLVIAATLGLFVLGVGALRQVPQQFFPLSNRPELIVDLWLPEGTSLAETEAAAKKVESFLAQDPDVVHYAAYLGGGTPRFFLLITQQLANTNLAEFVVMTRDTRVREAVMQRLRDKFATDLPQVRGRVMRLDVGPPLEYPVAFRVSGENPDVLRQIADQVAGVMRANPHTVDVTDDWNQRLPGVRLVVDQDKARALGVTSESLQLALQAHYTGIAVGQFRERDKLIPVIWRAERRLRQDLGGLADVGVQTGSGQWIPVSQIARIETVFEDGIIRRRDRNRTITINADIGPGVQAVDVAGAIERALAPLRADLPAGYHIETGAAAEQSRIAQGSIFIWLPLVAIVTVLLLMAQLHSLSRTLLVIVTAPLGVIGAAFFLLAFQAPFGFVALLGLIALAGMIMRNTVILVDQIDQDERAGADTWTAIVESTVRRFRPILLTAAAAILAMMPLARSDFFGAQALTIMGGLTVATVLTILFVPALYAAWFRVRRGARRESGNDPAHAYGPVQVPGKAQA